MLRPAITLLALAILTTSGCASLQPSNTEQVKIWHVVIIRLNSPGDLEARHKLVEATKQFGQIPGVKVAYVGTLLPANRPHADTNFDIGVIMGFATPQDLAAYASNPIHQKAVKELLTPLARDYSIYDFTNE